VDTVNRRGYELSRRVMLGAGVLALVMAACGGDDVVSTTGSAQTTAVAGDVVFGSGSIPEGFPSDFPIPEAATIGSTLVDSNRGRYEVILFVPAAQDAAIVYFEANLENVGYTITADGFEGETWRIEFERTGERGRMLLTLEDTEITSAALDLTIE